MRAVLVVGGGLAVGVALMLGILQPWKRAERAIPTVPSVPGVRADSVLEARGHIDEGRLDVAKVLLKAEVDAGRASALVHSLLALAHIRGGDLNAAQEELAKAAALDPELFETALFQGHLEMVSREHAAARRSYTEALKRRPGDPKALAGRAAARVELKESAGAVEDATGAIGSEPDALFTRAAAYSAMGQFQESVQDLTTYLARRPKDAQAWTNRGNAHQRLGRNAAAVADWKQATDLDPTLAERLKPLIEQAQ